MSWIESHQTLKEHPKLYKVMELLSINKAQAVGHLHLFWWWCVDYSPTGVLKDYNDLQVARAAEWSGEPKMFCNALVTARFLDRDCGVLTVHDWQEFTLHYDLMLDKKERNLEQVRERVRKFRERKRTCNANVTKCNAPTKPTIPNQPNQPKHLSTEKSGRPPPVALPAAENDQKAVGIPDFEALWTQYPNKDGRKQAVVVFKKTVLTVDDWNDIQNALINYLASDRVKKGYVKNGSTWFANWRDWIEYREEKKTTDDDGVPLKWKRQPKT